MSALDELSVDLIDLKTYLKQIDNDCNYLLWGQLWGHFN